jgi:hypothetical protein
MNHGTLLNETPYIYVTSITWLEMSLQNGFVRFENEHYGNYLRNSAEINCDGVSSPYGSTMKFHLMPIPHILT